jgi:hypothetical protein
MEIIISRPKQFADRIRAYELLIDGKTISKLKAGEEVRITLPENAKILTAKIDWCSSNEFNLSNVTANENIEVKNAISRKLWISFFAVYAITFKKNAYLSISKAA